MKQELICKEKQAQLEFGDILGIGMTLVVTVIGLAMGADVTGDIRDDMGQSACNAYWNASSQQCIGNATGNQTVHSANPLEYNITTHGLTGMHKLSVKLPTIITVMVIAIIIGVLVRHLSFKFNS